MEKEQPDFRLSDSVCFQQTIYFRTKNHQDKRQKPKVRKDYRLKDKTELLCAYPAHIKNLPIHISTEAGAQ